MDFWQNIVFISNFQTVNKGNQNETSRYFVFIEIKTAIARKKLF